jgi:glycosyltransferase involved in cell wall biosynthesis
MEKPRILIIENSVDVTGALKSITRTAYDLKKHFDFQFVIPTGSHGRSWIEGKGFTDIHELPMKEISRRFSSLALYIPLLVLNNFRLRKILKQERIELIHVNDLYNLLPVVYSAPRGRIPYVCHIRFLPNKFPKVLFDFWLKLHLRYAKKIITVSHAVMKQLPNHPKITVIPNELPVEEHHPEKFEPEIGKTTLIFLYLSNFIDGKGQNFALEAFSKIHKELPDWKLRFVGGDMGLKKNEAYRKSLQESARELGFFEKTEWIGFTEEVEREYKDADIVVNFSESESFSITCLEALYFGIPLIAPDCGGPSEIIDHQESGLLVENRNVASMAKAMLLLAQDKELRLRFSVEGMKRSSEKFSLEKTSNRLRDIYNSTLD